MQAILWTAIGCLIAGVVLLIMFFIGQGRAQRDAECAVRFNRLKGYLQIGYLVFFVAAAVLWFIY